MTGFGWVRRAEYQRVLSACAAWEVRYDQLLTQYHEQVAQQRNLTRDGYHALRDTVEMRTPEADDLGDAIQAAIAARGPTRDVQREMAAWARERLAAGLDPGDVADMVWAGDEGQP